MVAAPPIGPRRPITFVVVRPLPYSYASQKNVPIVEVFSHLATWTVANSESQRSQKRRRLATTCGEMTTKAFAQRGLSITGQEGGATAICKVVWELCRQGAASPGRTKASHVVS